MLNYIYHNYQNPITLSQISKVGKISIAQYYREILKTLLKCDQIKEEFGIKDDLIENVI